ncbi:MAG: RHS repeat-associated core domain-containing protein [Oscillospiraceae bacterium]
MRITNTSGTTVTEYMYDAWGNITSTTGTMASTVGAVNPFRYRSYYYDTDTGLYYLQSRYYDPVVKKFVNADNPAILGITCSKINGINVYGYCGNNPVIYEDPHGLFSMLHVYPINSDQLDDFARMIDNYVNLNTKKAGMRFWNGSGTALIELVNPYKIGTYLGVISLVDSLFPKANNELGAIRYAIDQIRFMYKDPKYFFIIDLLSGSKYLQIAVTTYTTYNPYSNVYIATRISRTVINFASYTSYKYLDRYMKLITGAKYGTVNVSNDFSF